MTSKVRAWIRLALFIVCLWLVIVGHSNIGKQGLAIELVGLAGLLVLLWDYNRPYRIK